MHQLSTRGSHLPLDVTITATFVKGPPLSAFLRHPQTEKPKEVDIEETNEFLNRGSHLFVILCPEGATSCFVKELKSRETET